ncbi:MAG: PAS domain-containing protein, partial [Polaromonas sp.]|nr:PAS domain-containing protein [Gemmatimonadaceae bacterium]
MTDQLAYHDSIRLAFQHSRHAGIIVAPDSPRWTILDVNDAYLAVTHRTRAALVGRPLFEQFPESDATRDDGGSRTLAESFVEALRGGPTAMPTRRYDLPVPGQPGTFHEHYWDFCTTALRDSDGTIIALLHEVENVTARVGIEGERRRLTGELEERNEVMQAQALELELTNHQLQKNAVELVAQAEELQATGAQLKERTEEAEEAKRRADTERARAENVLETMGDAYFALDSAFRFTRVNAAMEIGAAVSRDAIMGRTIWEVFPGTVGTEFERHYRAAALGTPAHFTRDYSDGNLELVVDVDAYQADGGGIAVFWRNVTPPIRAEAALRTKEEDLRTLANTLPTLAWTTRPDGYIDWYNDRWYAYTGTTPEEMEGWGWQSVHHPDVLMRVLEQWAHAIATGKSFEMTFPLRAADGTFRRFLTRATPLLDASGAILRWFGVNFDIEQEQAAREAVQTVVEAVTDGFVALDSSLRYTYVNQRAAEMWGWKAETLLGKSPVEIWPELDMENTPLLQLMRRVLTTQRTESLRAFAVSLDRWIELRVYPATNGGIVAFFQDMTDQRREEQAAMILAEASQLLASSTDYSQTLANMARAVVPRLGDWAAVDLVIDATDDGWPPQLERVATVHDDEDKLALAAELTSKYPERWADPNGMAGVIREGRAMYIPDVTDDMLVLGAKDAEHLRLLRALELRSIIVVPITARNRVLGALTLCMTESRRQYVDGDLALAMDLGQRAGVALDTVRLLRDPMDARAGAEAAAERTARLQDVTSALTSALTEEE